MTGNPFDDLSEKLDRIQADLTRLTEQIASAPPPAPPKRSYSPDEAAELFQRKPDTVRAWCRTGQINASKRTVSRKGAGFPWVISSDEIERFRIEGLLLTDTSRNKLKDTPPGLAS